MDEAFHAGEQALQAHTGQRERLAEVGRRIIRPAMPDAHRQFFQQLAIVGVISEAEAEAAVASGKVPAAMLALVDKLPQAERFGARMMLKGATVFERYSALIATLAALYRWDAAQTDSLFRKAAKL